MTVGEVALGLTVFGTAAVVVVTGAAGRAPGLEAVVDAAGVVAAGAFIAGRRAQREQRSMLWSSRTRPAGVLLFEEEPGNKRGPEEAR